MKKLYIIVIVVFLLFNACGCSEVEDLEFEYQGLKNIESRYEEHKDELEDTNDKLLDEIKTLDQEIESIEKQITSSKPEQDKLVEELISLKYKKDQSLGFTEIEHYQYFLEELKNNTNDWISDIYLEQAKNNGKNTNYYTLYYKEDSNCLIEIKYYIDGGWVYGIDVELKDYYENDKDLANVQQSCMNIILDGMTQLKIDKGVWKGNKQEHLKALIEGKSLDDKIGIYSKKESSDFIVLIKPLDEK